VKRIDPQLLSADPSADPSKVMRSAGSSASPSAGSLGQVAGFAPMGAGGDRGREVAARVGEIKAEDVDAARLFLSALPEVVREAGRTGEGAKALILGLLLSEDESVLRLQRELVRSTLGPQTVDYVETIRKQIGPVGAGSRLPLLETILPALRHLAAEEKSTLLVLLRELVWADREYHMFEYVILTLVRSQLSTSRARIKGVSSLSAGRKELSVLISAIAHIGARDESEARNSLTAALPHFTDKGAQPEFLTAEQCGALQLESALNRLHGLQPLEKQKLIEACVKVILSDRVALPEEIETLQAVCTVLDVPVPSKSLFTDHSAR
jgi:hypothetical protein